MDRLQSCVQTSPCLGRGETDVTGRPPAGVSVAIGDRRVHSMPRQGTRGRVPKPRRYPPPDLCYAVVVKERAHGRVVHVTTRIVYGTTEQMRPPRSKLRGIKRISSS